MSEAIAFDTHRFVKHLTENGFTEQQAEVLADEQVHLLNANLATQADIAAIHQDTAAIQRDIVEVRREIEVLRQETKADIDALRQGTQANIATVRQEIEVLRQETKANLAEIRRDIAEVKADLIKWMVGALIAQGGVIVALLKLLPG